MKTQGFTDRSMFAPAGPQPPNAPRGAEHALVTVRVIIAQMRPASLLVHAEGDDPQNTVWLPRSLCTIQPGLVESGLRHKGKAFPLQLPRWKAQETGLAAFAGEGQGRLF